MEPVNFRMKGDVEGLPPIFQLPPALRQGRTGDPFKIIRPALRDLDTAEAVRVLSVVDDALWRVDIITALDQLWSNRKDPVEELGSDLTALLDQHLSICSDVDGLRSRSEVIKKLTSFQLRDVYYTDPRFSFKSFETSESSVQSDEPSADEVALTKFDLQAVPWGPAQVDLGPSSDLGSDQDSITNMKRAMMEDGETTKQKTVVTKTTSDQESSLSLSIRWSDNSIDREDGEGQREAQETITVTADTEEDNAPIEEDNAPFENEPTGFKAMSQPDLLSEQASDKSTGGEGDAGVSLSETSSLPWASMQEIPEFSAYDMVTESFQQRKVISSLKLVQKRLAMLLRNILRVFGRNPPLLDRILASKKRTDPSQEFLSELRELGDFLRLRLLTTASEEREKQRHVEEVVKAIAAYEALIARLENEIKKVNDDKIAKCREMNDLIRKLHLDIVTVEKLGEEIYGRTRQEEEKLKAIHNKLSLERRQKPLQDLAEITARFAKLRNEHWESEAMLRKKRYKVETEVDNWIKRYDEDMTALQVEYDEVEAAYMNEKKLLEEMEDKFEPMEAKFREVKEERELLYKKRMAKEREDLRRIQSVHAIQAWWRSYRVRKAVRIKYQKLEKQRLKELKRKGKKGKKGKAGKSGTKPPTGKAKDKTPKPKGKGK